MKDLNRLVLPLCSVIALFLLFSCTNEVAPEPENVEETKIEVGSEYKVPSGKQVYRMVTKRPNRSNLGNLVQVWYYDDKDELVYYSEEDAEYFDNVSSDGYSEGTVTSYTDETKSAVFGKQVTTFRDTESGNGNYILDEDFDGNNKKISSRIEVYELDEGGSTMTYIECEYDPNESKNNVFKYSAGTIDATDFHDILLTEYYEKNLTWNPATRTVSGDLYPQKQTAYLYDDTKTVQSGLFTQPLCVGYITTINDYDDTTAEVNLLHTNYSKTEYRWSTSLYSGGPLEEISYNLEYDEDADAYRTVEQCGYKIIQVEEFEGEMLPVQEIWFTAEGNIQYKYVYDYDIDPTDELLTEEQIAEFGHSHYLTKKSYYQNSSSGLFLAESSEFLRYNIGENKDYRYEVEIYTTYDNM